MKAGDVPALLLARRSSRMLLPAPLPGHVSRERAALGGRTRSDAARHPHGDIPSRPKPPKTGLPKALPTFNPITEAGLIANRRRGWAKLLTRRHPEAEGLPRGSAGCGWRVQGARYRGAPPALPAAVPAGCMGLEAPSASPAPFPLPAAGRVQRSSGRETPASEKAPEGNGESEKKPAGGEQEGPGPPPRPPPNPAVPPAPRESRSGKPRHGAGAPLAPRSRRRAPLPLRHPAREAHPPPRPG